MALYKRLDLKKKKNSELRNQLGFHIFKCKLQTTIQGSESRILIPPMTINLKSEIAASR